MMPPGTIILDILLISITVLLLSEQRVPTKTDSNAP